MNAGRHDSYASLRVPNYRWFVLCLLAMTVASQIQAVVVAWQIYAITKDPLSLGLIGLAEALPFISLALYAGHLADRRDRRGIALLALAVLFACSVALLWLTLRHAVAVWPYYAVIFASGIARSFLIPSRTALAAELVPRELYANAVAWRSSTWQFAAVVGPAVGGLLYAFGGPGVAYGADAVLMVVAVVAMVRVRHPRRAAAVTPASIAESLGEGIRWVRSQPIILGAMTLDLFSVLFGGATALLPIFASDILRVGPQGLGLLRAAPAAGAVVMSLIVAHGRPMTRAGRALLVNVALFGACMIAFGLSRSFALSLALLAASGMVDTISVVVRSTLLQVLTPDALLGRVAAVNAIFIGSSNEVGAFESGVAARLLGAVPAVVLGGAATLGVVAATAWRVPELRRLRELRREEEAVA
jgi:MFS family permease